MQGTYLNGVDIRVETFDTTLLNNLEYKLDILFYNTINRYGKILTSMVFNSGVKASDDTSVIIYNPNKLLLNSAFENTYALSGNNSNVWKNNTIITGGKSMLKDNSRGAIYGYKDYTLSANHGVTLATDYAVAYLNGDYAYDGWYTLCSVALPLSVGSPVKGNFLYNGAVAQYYNGATYTNLNTVADQTLPIYNFLDGLRGEQFYRYDFVSTVKINSLYCQLLDEKFDSAWFKKINVLSPKMSTLHHAIEFKRYDIAQHIINAVNYSLLSLLI